MPRLKTCRTARDNFNIAGRPQTPDMDQRKPNMFEPGNYATDVLSQRSINKYGAQTARNEMHTNVSAKSHHNLDNPVNQDLDYFNNSHFKSVIEQSE